MLNVKYCSFWTAPSLDFFWQTVGEKELDFLYSVVCILAILSLIQVVNWHENSFTSLFKQGNYWAGEEETLLQVREDPFPKGRMILGLGEGQEGVFQSVVVQIQRITRTVYRCWRGL